MTAIPNQHWGGENRTSVSRFVTSIVASQSKQRQLNKPWLTKDIGKKETDNVLYTFLKQRLTKNRRIYILCSYSFTC